ncbi:hypothetical protein HPB50_023835 [Hyalomma asiaticum]|uniref:Uncharacterized protein n=1 Tax=Hyalomma asiaticum TaxID=266040 RepID=A0ACB7SW47_HYAAI|nr:hypothetical protein HPB50_023835 [Hyalomma asiaticum]
MRRTKGKVAGSLDATTLDTMLLNGPLDVPHGAFLSWASPSHGSGSNNGIGGGNVQGPQLTSDLPSRLLFSNSSGGSLPCSATGQPAPTIRWLTEDGEEAADVPRLRHVRQGDGSLVFLPFRADQFRRDVHEARYRCSASNAIGTVVSPQVHVTAVIQVKAPTGQGFRVPVSEIKHPRLKHCLVCLMVASRPLFVPAQAHGGFIAIKAPCHVVSCITFSSLYFGTPLLSAPYHRLCTVVSVAAAGPSPCSGVGFPRKCHQAVDEA